MRGIHLFSKVVACLCVLQNRTKNGAVILNTNPSYGKPLICLSANSVTCPSLNVLPVLLCNILACPVLSCQPCHALPYPILQALPCPVLPALSCPALQHGQVVTIQHIWWYFLAPVYTKEKVLYLFCMIAL